jgi:hypothetical protein
MPVRPTLRCLREDLRLPLPPASVPLDQVDHPLLTKAGEQFADPVTSHERIRAIGALAELASAFHGDCSRQGCELGPDWTRCT